MEIHYEADNDIQPDIILLKCRAVFPLHKVTVRGQFIALQGTPDLVIILFGDGDGNLWEYFCLYHGFWGKLELNDSSREGLFPVIRFFRFSQTNPIHCGIHSLIHRKFKVFQAQSFRQTKHFLQDSSYCRTGTIHLYLQIT